MGYEVYAIKPDDVDADPLNSPDLFLDPWYTSRPPYVHPFWHCWRDHRTEAGYSIPDEVYTSMRNVGDVPKYALESADSVERFAASLPERDDGLLGYAQWIRHWANEGASFLLSR